MVSQHKRKVDDMNFIMKIHRKRKIKLIHISFIAIIVLIASFTNITESKAYTSKTGVVNGTNVNVRTGAGTSNSILQHEGVNVQLHIGHNVTIVDETTSGGDVWYKITFNFSGTSLTGYMRYDFITVSTGSYTPDTDFEAYLTAQGFPESYKGSLRVLHTKYPNWVFVADRINYNWSDVVAAQSVVGRSLIAYNSISSWKSLSSGAYDWSTGTWASFDGTAWAAASEELVAYCLDPRNFLDEQSIFQYESLSFQPVNHTLSGVQSMVTNTFLNNSVEGFTYSQIFMDASSQYGVSPYHLVARVLQEQGTSGTSGITGVCPGYSGYYNFFNIGAYAANGRTAIENGLLYASQTDASNLRPWNSRYKSILGGSKFIASGYINIGQDTLYYQKFDYVGTPYTHQYMTHILAPSKEGIRMSGAYSAAMKNSIALTFKIPVYNNMSATVNTCPTGTGSPNNVLASLTVGGYSLTPTFSKFTTSYDLIVDNSVSSITVAASPVDSLANVTGAGVKSLSVGANTITINVTAQTGATRAYTLNIVRQAPTTVEDTIDGGAKVTSTYNIASNGIISGISVGTTVNNANTKFTLTNCTAKFLKADGSENTGTIGTGTRYVVYNASGVVIKEYPIVIYGDLNGDGLINTLDMLYLKKHILNINTLSGINAHAGNIDKNSGINTLDILYLKRHILNISAIVQ